MGKNKVQPAAPEPKKGMPTRRLLAAWLLQENPTISDQALERALDQEFPDDRLARSDASRYRILWNQGRLWAPSTDPRTW